MLYYPYHVVVPLASSLEFSKGVAGARVFQLHASLLIYRVKGATT